MKKQQNKYIYEYATSQDGVAISELLEEVAFDGDISITYARRENACISLQQDSEYSQIVVAKNVYDNKIYGIGMCSINTMRIGNKLEKVAYLSGFRKKQNAVGDIIHMYKLIQQFCKNNNVKYTYTTILEDNIIAQKLLTKKRKNMPQYVKIADYTVNIFKSNLKRKTKYICEKATANDLENLKSFVEKESKNKIFFPYLDLDMGFFGLTYKDFYLLKNQTGEILACGILWNQKKYKQLIVKHYSLKYKIITKLANWILKLINYPTLPAVGEIIDYSTLSFVLCKNNNENYLNDFIREISHHVQEKIFVYGSTKQLSEKITPMTYKSFVYIVDWDKNFDKIDLSTDNLNIECALL